MKVFRRLIAAFVPPTTGPAEREYRKTCKSRTALGIGEFYSAYYANTEIPFDTCARVLRVLKTQLNMANVRPNDNIAQIFDDIGLAEICSEIGDEFQFRCPVSMIDDMDGSIDSIIRLTERCRVKLSGNDAKMQT